MSGCGNFLTKKCHCGRCKQDNYHCKPLLHFGVFQELNDVNYFLMAKVEHGTVVWPDTLYLEGKEIEKECRTV
jgi:hypothetical protein